MGDARGSLRPASLCNGRETAALTGRARIGLQRDRIFAHGLNPCQHSTWSVIANPAFN
jgi:hypothetical protein